MKVNGEEKNVKDGTPVSDWLISQGYDVSKSAVLLNGKVVPRGKLGTTALHDGDRMEIVSFVGGG